MDERSYAFVPPPPPAASLAAAGAVEHVPPSIDTAHLAAAALRQAQIDLASAGALLEREGTGLGAEELVAIVDDVQHGVAGLLATKKHGLRLQLCQEVQRAAQALRAELEARVAEMGLKRAMSDPRMRGNLEILAYTTKARADAAVLAVGAASVHTSLRAAAPAASAVASRSLSPSLATGTAIKGARAISDADGRLFWETHFGAQVSSVTWPHFLSSISAFLGAPLTASWQHTLQTCLDHAGSGYVSAFKLDHMLAGFGPGLRAALSNAAVVINSSWFYGHVSFDEASELLRGQPAGAFLVRFSTSQPGAFAVAFVDDREQVQQAIVTATPSAGFVLNGQAFASLPAVVAAHQHVLRSPLVHPLKGCRWFRGFLTYEQSVALLAGRPPGTFLLRFSRSQPGSLAVAFTAEDGKVQQSIVQSVPPRGYVVAGTLFRTLDDFLHAFRHKLRVPADLSDTEQRMADARAAAADAARAAAAQAAAPGLPAPLTPAGMHWAAAGAAAGGGSAEALNSCGSLYAMRIPVPPLGPRSDSQDSATGGAAGGARGGSAGSLGGGASGKDSAMAAYAASYALSDTLRVPDSAVEPWPSAAAAAPAAPAAAAASASASEASSASPRAPAHRTGPGVPNLLPGFGLTAEASPRDMHSGGALSQSWNAGAAAGGGVGAAAAGHDAGRAAAAAEEQVGAIVWNDSLPADRVRRALPLSALACVGVVNCAGSFRSDGRAGAACSEQASWASDFWSPTTVHAPE